MIMLKENPCDNCCYRPDWGPDCRYKSEICPRRFESLAEWLEWAEGCLKNEKKEGNEM